MPTAAKADLHTPRLLAWLPARCFRAPTATDSLDWRQNIAAGQRRSLLVPIGLIHAGALWALVHSMAPAVLPAVRLTHVQLLTDPDPRSAPAPQPELSAPARRQPQPQWLPVPDVVVTPAQPNAAEATPATSPTAPAEAAAVVGVVTAASSPEPARPALPERQVSISQVAYLAPPVLDYPLAARRRREEGVVHVRVRVDAGGRPDQAAVIRSSGHDALDRAALATVRATRFKPYTEDGLPRPFWVVMPLVFELES